MSRTEAPGGASSADVVKPAISLLAPKQGSQEEQAGPTVVRIERMLRGVFQNEETISTWERIASLLKSNSGRRRIKAPGESHPRCVDPLSELASLRKRRDDHLDEIRHVIDYGLTTEAYRDVRCSDCEPWTLPAAPLDFIRVVASAERPATATTICKTCKGRGKVREKRTDPEAKAAFKRITYFKSVLDTTALCAKIRYKTAEADDAYRELESQNSRLFNKFGKETQTSLEEEDALQGVRKGIVDAAMRFDPTRREGANFTTVAYNWAYRNSRHRREGEKRAGVYAQSIETIGSSNDGTALNPTAMLASSDGAFGSFSTVSDDNTTLVMDLRDKLGNLSKNQQAIMAGIMDGHNTSKVARLVGLPVSVVKRLRDEAFSYLRENLSGYVDVIRD